MNKQQFTRELEHLPQQLAPTKELWQGIEKAINLPQGQHAAPVPAKTQYSLWALAASVFIMVGISLWFNPRLISPQALPIAQQMQQSFEQQQQLLLVQYQQQALVIPAQIEQQLVVLQQAQQQLLQALAKQPNDANLLALLNFTQQQVIQLLTQVPQASYQHI